jgi:hypothetical protein
LRALQDQDCSLPVLVLLKSFLFCLPPTNGVLTSLLVSALYISLSVQRVSCPLLVTDMPGLGQLQTNATLRFGSGDNFEKGSLRRQHLLEDVDFQCCPTLASLPPAEADC